LEFLRSVKIKKTSNFKKSQSAEPIYLSKLDIGRVSNVHYGSNDVIF